MNEQELFAETLKALSDPTRLEILKVIVSRERTAKPSVTELGETLGIAQPNVSHHMKILKHAGFVRCEKHGGCSYYVANRDRFVEIIGFLNDFMSGGDRKTD